MMRPGRLDRLIYVGPPSREDRVEILGIKMKGMAVDPNIDIEELAILVRQFYFEITLLISI